MNENSSRFEARTLSNPPEAPRPKRRFNKLNLILLAAVIIGAIIIFRTNQQRRDVSGQLEETSSELEEIRQATDKDTKDAARGVLEKLKQHIVIPDQPDPTVATIVNVDTLKQANSFYETAKNGDYLIITEKRAILYNPDLDVVIDVVPIEVDGTAENAQTNELNEEAEPLVDPSISPSELITNTTAPLETP